MKAFSIMILSLYFASITFGQQYYPDSGFTNKAEAKNLTVNGVKHGKWLEFVTERDQPVAWEKETAFYVLIVYKDGMPFGIARKYDGRWLFATTQYINGKKNGIMRKWYFNKQVKSEIPYINDTISGIEKDYFEKTGNLKCEIPYSHNLINGVQRAYRTDGKTILSETEFVDGKKNGITKDYYEDEKLQYETNYSDDRKNGVERMFMENGKLAWEATYVNGVLNDTSIKAPQDNIPDSSKNNVGNVNGFIQVVHPWCTDVLTDRTAEYTKPRPSLHKRMYVRRGDSNDFSKPIISEFTTDSTGSFHISLPPGVYVIIAENKKNKPNYDSLLTKYANGTQNCYPIKASDTICISRWYRTPDATFIIGNNCIKDISIIYQLPCSFECDLPCLNPKNIIK